MQTGLILGIVCYFAMASFVLAQTATAVIRGTVLDRRRRPQGRSYFLLLNEPRNQSWEQATNEDGLFEFRALPFGNYTVEVERPRFRKGIIDNIALQEAETEN